MSKLSALRGDVKRNPAVAAGAVGVAVVAGLLAARKRSSSSSPAKTTTTIQPAAGYTGFDDARTDAWLRALDGIAGQVDGIGARLWDLENPAPDEPSKVPPVVAPDGSYTPDDGGEIWTTQPVTPELLGPTFPVTPPAIFTPDPNPAPWTTGPVDLGLSIPVMAPSWTAEGGINPQPWSATGRDADADGNRIADGIDEILAARSGSSSSAPQDRNLDAETIALLQQINAETGNTGTVTAPPPANPAPWDDYSWLTW